MPSSVRKGPKPGSRNRAKRDPGVVVHANRPATRVEVALGTTSAAVTPEEWPKLREKTWDRWLKLVGEPPDPDSAAKRQALVQDSIERGTIPTEAQERRVEEPVRDSVRDWPPAAATFDGIEGHALRTYGAPAIVRSFAADGLAEVERFKKADPDAARSIAGPLREYVRRLRRVRERPELRTYDRRPV
ncbi:MAG: hypothetical protein ACRDMH_02830 [Solirubrobacterales bacterium]